MKILHTVEYYHPSIGGAQEVVRQLSERLVRKGHDVTVATSFHPDRAADCINGVKVVQFKVSGNCIDGYTGETDEYLRFLSESDFDVTLNYAAQQWTTDLMLPVLEQIRGKKVFVPCGFSCLQNPSYTEYFDRLVEHMQQYDRCIYLSNVGQDIRFARSRGLKNDVIVPNGASEEEFDPSPTKDVWRLLGIPEKNSLILHVGSHTGLKGHRDLFRIFNEAHVENATLLLVANPIGLGCTARCKVSSVLFNASPGNQRSHKNTIVVSVPRETVVAAYHAADLFLFPSNVECSPIVLFECMASKTPFLTTDVGNAREIVEWSDAGLLLPTHKDQNGYARADISRSARILEDLLQNQEYQAILANNGHNAWKERFTWEKIADTYEMLYRMLIGE